MINGLLISQLIGTNLQGEEALGQHAASTDPGVSFQSVLGGMMTASGQPFGTQAGTASPSASILPQGMNIPSDGSFGSMVDASSNDVPQPILQLIEFLNQASGEQHIPLDILIDLQNISQGQLDILKDLGLDLSEPVAVVTAVLNAGELEKIKGQVLSGGGQVDIPVNALFTGEGELLSGFSALNATLSVQLSPGEANSSNSANPDQAALTFRLNLFSEQASGSDAAGPESNTSTGSIANWSGEIVRVVEHLRALLSGTSAGMSPGSGNDLGENLISDNNNAQVAGLNDGDDAGIGRPASGAPVNPVSSGSESLLDENTILDYNNTQAAGLTGSDDAGIGRPAYSTQINPASARPVVSAVDAAAGFDPVAESNTLTSEMLLVLADLVGARLQQAAETDDPQKASGILSLLENLAALEELPAGEQLEAINSLIEELEGLGLAYPDTETGPEAVVLPESGVTSTGGDSSNPQVQPGEIETAGSGDSGQANGGRAGQLDADTVHRVVGRLYELAGLISDSLTRTDIVQTENFVSEGMGARVSVESELHSIADSARQLSQTIASVAGELGLGAGVISVDQPGDSTNNNAQQSSTMPAGSELTETVSGLQQTAEADIARSDSSEHPAVVGSANSNPAVDNQTSPTMDNQISPELASDSGFSPVTAADGNSPLNAGNQTVAARGPMAQPNVADAPGQNGAANTSNINSNLEDNTYRQTGNQTLPAENTENQTDTRSKTLSSNSGSTGSSANAGRAGNTGEFSNTSALENGRSPAEQTRPGRENVSRISIPVSLEEQRFAESTPRASGRREAVMVYANQVQQGKTDSFNDQVKTVSRTGVENASSTDILSGVIESVQGKGGTLKDHPGNYSKPENLAALKAESLHQGLHSESGNIRLSGAGRGEQTAQPNGGGLFTNQAEIVGRITQAARLTTGPGTSEITLRLEPDHLGQMRVRLSVDENQFVSARIQVESQEARSLIESSLQRLRDSLAEQGLKVEKFSVDVRQDQNQQQGQQSAMAGRENAPRSRGSYLFNEESTAAERESSFVPQEKTASVRKLGYNTLEWVA